MKKGEEGENTSGEGSYSDSSDSTPDFLSGVPKEQKELMLKRMSSIRSEYKTFSVNQADQKYNDLHTKYPELNSKSIELLLQSSNNNEILALRRLRDDPQYLNHIEKMGNGEEPVDMEVIMYVDPRSIKLQDDANSSDDSEDWNYRGKSKTKRKTHRTSSSDDSSTSELEKLPQRRKVPRLLLNDAMSMLSVPRNTLPRNGSCPKPKNRRKSEKVESDESDSMESLEEGDEEALNREEKYTKSIEALSRQGVSRHKLESLNWSEARIRAYNSRNDNPNVYYYRFLDPGETQNTGKWSAEDRCTFLKHIIEKGVNYSWGEFSIGIPGRVGYQCSNYYRLLIKEGVIIDENYSVDREEKLTFRYKERSENPKKSVSKRHRKPAYTKVYPSETVYREEDINCLPEYIDPMTMSIVEIPTISPYGHVMGYHSWLKVLNREPKNTCPFTKQRLTRRQLVKLTVSNIDEYRSKIVDINVDSSTNKS